MKVVVVVASGFSDNQTSEEQIAEWLQHFHKESEHHRNHWKNLCTPVLFQCEHFVQILCCTGLHFSPKNRVTFSHSPESFRVYCEQTCFENMEED